MEKRSSPRLSPHERRAALLKAAAEVFFEQGYAASNIDAIIQRAGGSKRSIYTEFGNKEGLFTALIMDTAAEITAPAMIDLDGSLRSRLLHFAGSLIRLLMSPNMLGLYRTALAEGCQYPVLARLVFERGIQRAVQELAKILQAAQEEDMIRDIDCKLAAEIFVGMLCNNLHMEVILKLRPAPDSAEVESIASTATDIFLDGLM